MNYRHIFHAGNFGDVLKHALLVPLVRAMQRKEKSFLFLDTHAGIGTYDLTSSRADRTAEHVDGIGRLWSREDLPKSLCEYVQIVRDFNEGHGGGNETIRYYPGSPMVAAGLLRPQDRIALSELHGDDFLSLRENMQGTHGQVSAQQIDAYSALKAYLPPPEKRALVLIDPPYENHNETSLLHAGLATALERFRSGVYAIWYPIKDHAGCEAFRSMMDSLPLPPALAVELTVRSDAMANRLNGSGLLILNPPWKIEADLVSVAESLRQILAQDSGARADLIWLRERV